MQKNMQMTNEMLREMMELACVWQWLLPNLKRMLGSGVELEKIQEAWEMGSLDCTVRLRVCLNGRYLCICLSPSDNSSAGLCSSDFFHSRIDPAPCFVCVCVCKSHLSAMATFRFTKKEVRFLLKLRRYKIKQLWGKQEYLRNSETWLPISCIESSWTQQVSSLSSKSFCLLCGNLLRNGSLLGSWPTPLLNNWQNLRTCGWVKRTSDGKRKRRRS